MDFLTTLKELRKNDKRNFEQTFDLIINLKNYDLRTKPINLFVELPHPFKENKVCAFLEGDSPDVDRVVGKLELPKWGDKKAIKKLARDYDIFISSMKLMGPVATTFGKVLGPLGKMPNPKFGGVLMKEDAPTIKALVEKLKKMVSIRPKEISIKVAVGRESMTDEQINDNIKTVYNAVTNAVTNECIKTTLLKLTMSKPLKVAQ